MFLLSASCWFECIWADVGDCAVHGRKARAPQLLQCVLKFDWSSSEVLDKFALVSMSDCLRSWASGNSSFVSPELLQLSD